MISGKAVSGLYILHKNEMTKIDKSSKMIKKIDTSMDKMVH